MNNQGDLHNESQRSSHRFSMEEFASVKASLFKKKAKKQIEIPRLKLPATCYAKPIYGTMNYNKAKLNETMDLNSTITNKENVCQNVNISYSECDNFGENSSKMTADIQITKLRNIVSRFLLENSKQNLKRSLSNSNNENYPKTFILSLRNHRNLSQPKIIEAHQCFYSDLLKNYLKSHPIYFRKNTSYATQDFPIFSQPSKTKVQNTRYLQSISYNIPINDITKNLKISKPPLPEALSHRSMSPNTDNTPRFIENNRTEYRKNSKDEFAASEICVHTSIIDNPNYELEEMMSSKILPKTLRQIKPDLRSSILEAPETDATQRNKEKLWKYVFELQKQIMDLQVKLKESQQESALGVIMCSKIKDEAAIIKQDLEHQIEDLTSELSQKDEEIQRLTNNAQAKNITKIPIQQLENCPNQIYDLELRANLSPRYLQRIPSNALLNAKPLNNTLLKPHENDTIDISFEGNTQNDKSYLMRMDTSNVSEILPDNSNNTQIIPGTTKDFCDALNKLSAPSMDLRILLSKNDYTAPENQNSDFNSMLSEMNTAYQTHIKQLLEEKREMAEIARKNAESAEEERRLLEAKIQELSTEAEISRINQRNSMIGIENEEIIEFKKLKENIEEEKRILKHKKNAFNKKLIKLREIQEQLNKRDEELKENDVKMKVKQKKLFFKKQALEKEWKNLEEQKDRLASDIKDIEYEWESVTDLKGKLVATGKKIGEIRRSLKQEHENIENKQNELDKTLSEYKSQMISKEEMEKKIAKIKEKEDSLIEQEENLRKDREGVVTMRLKMNEELRQLNAQKRIIENLKQEFDVGQINNSQNQVNLLKPAS